MSVPGMHSSSANGHGHHDLGALAAAALAAVVAPNSALLTGGGSSSIATGNQGMISLGSADSALKRTNRGQSMVRGSGENGTTKRYRVDIHLKGKNHKFPGHYSLADKKLIHEWARQWKGKARRKSKSSCIADSFATDTAAQLSTDAGLQEASVLCLRKNQEPQRWTRKDAFHWFEQKSNPKSHSERAKSRTPPAQYDAAASKPHDHYQREIQMLQAQGLQNEQHRQQLAAMSTPWNQGHSQNPFVFVPQKYQTLGKRSAPLEGLEIGASGKVGRFDGMSSVQQQQQQKQQQQQQPQQHSPISQQASHETFPAHHAYFAGMHFLGAAGATHKNISAQTPIGGRILSIHPQTVDYTERVSTLVQVKWTAPIRYLDTKPAGWRIHFLTLDDNFGTFDAKGLPPGNYTIDNTLFCVEQPGAPQVVAPMPPGQPILGQQPMQTLLGDVYSKDVAGPAMAKAKASLQLDSRRNESVQSLAQAKAKLLLAAPCYAPLISILTEDDLQLPPTIGEDSMSPKVTGEAAIDLLSINEPMNNAQDPKSIHFASKDSLALAWAAVQQFYRLAGKKPSAHEDVEAFIHTHTGGVDLTSASVTVYDMMKPPGSCVSFQSTRSRLLYGNFASSEFSVDTVTLNHIFEFFISSRCDPKILSNKTVHIRRNKDAKIFELTPIMVSTSPWQADHMMCIIVDVGKFA